MSNFIKIAFAIVVWFCMVAFTTHAAIDCQKVASSIAPCTTYLQKGGAVPSDCCDGLRSIFESATTTALRRAYCECMESSAKTNGFKAQFAATLLSNCNVKTSYPISNNTTCNSIQ